MKIAKCIALLILFSIPSQVAYTYQQNKAINNALMHARSKALISRFESAQAGYEEFRKTVYKEPFEHGVFIVNGDTPIVDEEELKEFYYREIVREWKSTKFGIQLDANDPFAIIDTDNGKPVTWSSAEKKNLSYCVSRTFADKYETVVKALRLAADAWENSSDVKYVHISSLDQNCDSSTKGVVFDVRPVDVGRKYFARAFFPKSDRTKRNILINKSAFTLEKDGPHKLTLVGILRHELGHTLAFRHEHIRPEAGQCIEDTKWEPVTDYDAFSVMHYPTCNDLVDWTLNLTAMDKIGAACLYGPKPGTSFSTHLCKKNFM
ncbi:matrixin family metalloprotease [Cellvibrio sp. UBA7671]|uniref:matrixin family metalloprotease n=1 Tax=Cellvibrio sp. UBA7671 TaxID=1946312 RepID=UPI002F355936